VLPVLVTTTVAVLVSVAPEPLSVPAAAPPSFSLRPNHGSGPIWNVVAGLGVATMVAVPPGATEAVTIGAVEAAPPLMVTEHHASKFRTVRVTFPPPASGVPPLPPSPPPSTGGAPVSAAPLELPPEVPFDPPLDPLLELADPPLELAAAPPLELVLASSGVDASDGEVAGVELLLQAMVPASVSAPMLVTASQLVRIVCISSLQVAGILSPETQRKRALLALPRS
jgi:hypothetical protein